MKTHIFLLFLCLSPVFSVAQYTFGFQQEYFFGRLPSAQMEAMGRANVAVGGSLASSFFNPAGIGLIQGQEAAFSTSAPFYVLFESDYTYLGTARRFRSNMVGAISLNRFAIGPTTFDININGQRYPLDLSSSNNISLSYAIEPVKGLHIGTNVNTYLWKYIEEVPVTSAFHIDLGALYRKTLNESKNAASHLQLGASLTNATFGGISFASPLGDEDQAEFPSVLRVGAAFITEGPVDCQLLGLNNLRFTGTLEYQNVVNSDYRSGIRLGTETVIWEVLAVRLGYFTHSLYNLGNPDNRDQMRDLTFGFGLIIPFEQLLGERLPFNLHVDYTALKQPPTTFGGTRLDNMRTFSFRFVWDVGE